MCSHDSGEKFGQPGVSCGTQVLQEFHMDVVVIYNYSALKFTNIYVSFAETNSSKG